MACGAYVFLRSKWSNFCVERKWIHVDTLRHLPASVCFVHVRNTESWITVPIPHCVPFLWHKGIRSQMMGDEVLRRKFPHPRFREFSWLIYLQRTSGVCVLTRRKDSCPPKCGVQIGSHLEHDINVMPVEPWMIWGGNMEEKSNPQISSCQETATQVAGDWREMGRRGSAYVLWPIGTRLVVMLQWDHSPWNI
jgi:hypothetical protein